MKKLLLFLTVTALIVLSCSQSNAQTSDYVLRGISGFMLIIEDLNPVAAKCGITKEDLKTAILFPISTAKLTIDARPAPFMYLRVTVLERGLDCIASYEITFYDLKPVKKIDGITNIMHIEYWQKTHILVDNKNNFSKSLYQSIEQLSKLFVIDWSFDNK